MLQGGCHLATANSLERPSERVRLLSVGQKQRHTKEVHIVSRASMTNYGR